MSYAVGIMPGDNKRGWILFILWHSHCSICWMNPLRKHSMKADKELHLALDVSVITHYISRLSWISVTSQTNSSCIIKWWINQFDIFIMKSAIVISLLTLFKCKVLFSIIGSIQIVFYFIFRYRILKIMYKKKTWILGTLDNTDNFLQSLPSTKLKNVSSLNKTKQTINSISPVCDI